MLRGLEISEVLLSKVKTESYSYRWDSTYFLKEFIFSPLENIATDYIKTLFDIRSGTTPRNRDETLKSGTILLKTNDIRNNVLKDKGDSFFYIDNSTNSKMKSTELKPNDVLINIVGATTEVIGRVSYISDSFPKANITQAMSLMRAKQTKVTPQYLFCFLLSKYGNMQVRRFARPTGQFNMNHSELGGFEIPLLSLDFQQKLTELVSKNNKLELTSKQTYTQAENLLLQEIGLQNFTPSKEPVNIKSFKESFATSGRLDAEYYQLKYEGVLNKVKNNNFNTLNNLVDINKSIEPGSRNYAENGLPFIRVADLSKNGLSEPKKYISDYFVKENQDKINDLKPKKGTILFSKDGSVGIAFHLRQNYNGITSGAILHLNVKDEKKILPEYLTLALNSKVVQMQAERDAGGSIILHWRVGEIENVVVPIIDFGKQLEIADLIEQSFSLKKQSEHLLEVAKKAVEIAIEQNEEIAIEYINNQSNSNG